MKQVIILIMLILPQLSYGKIDEAQLLERIDMAIERDGYYQQNKEKEIKRLKRQVANSENDKLRLLYLDSIYQAYSTYRYDSATAYVEKGMKLAESCNDTYYIIRNKINRASVLSVGGFYSQSEELLKTLDPSQMPHSLQMRYYFTFAWLYNYWSAFCANSEFSQGFVEKKKHYLGLLLQHADAQERITPVYYYLKGEYIYLDHPTHKNVLAYYSKALKLSPVKSRTHASAAYGIARYYLDLEQYDLYEKYLVIASESDAICQLKETLALQKLAYYLFKKNESYSKRAAKYIRHSMEDAKFFNNRLRMIEISNILPVIAASNQQAAERSRTRLLIGFIVVSILLLGFLALAIVNTKQKRSLKKSRREIKKRNEEQEKMNLQLIDLNKRLVATNKRRETYMRLFMDISAAYIKKLDDYRKLVSRKIKTNQTNDLLKSINSYKLAEEDSKMFYNRFDKAFLELYPDFVDELNKLLLPQSQLSLPSNSELTTEIRIYALMRLGVTDSQEIATLLYYSTQTIYNYKSGMRAKAKNRETFEEDINRLCHLI